MRDLGELMLYIEILNFGTKQELKAQLEEMLENSEDSLAKSSLQKALSVLESATEDEIKKAKESF